MKLYVWTGVLYDYTAGMIVALAPDLETALAVARKGEYSYAAPEEMGRETPQVINLPGCEPVEPQVWVVHGGG